jgi:hypothetical protein
MAFLRICKITKCKSCAIMTLRLSSRNEKNRAKAFPDHDDQFALVLHLVRGTLRNDDRLVVRDQRIVGAVATRRP